jgi:hypothetical protein
MIRTNEIIRKIQEKIWGMEKGSTNQYSRFKTIRIAMVSQAKKR